jgi:hypothetical protein
MSNVVELTTPSERDQQVVALRLAGVNLARIAREVGLGGTKEVIAALERALPTVDAAYRGRILREELARLDQLQSWWYAAAKTSASAAAIVLKIAERRAAMLALDAPQHVRLDPVQVIAGGEPKPSSSEALLRELNRIANERSAGGLATEAEPPSDPAA